jgi:hypothetical protein
MWAGMLADLAAMSSSAPMPSEPPSCPASLTAAAVGIRSIPNMIDKSSSGAASPQFRGMLLEISCGNLFLSMAQLAAAQAPAFACRARR